MRARSIFAIKQEVYPKQLDVRMNIPNGYRE